MENKAWSKMHNRERKEKKKAFRFVRHTHRTATGDAVTLWYLNQLEGEEGAGHEERMGCVKESPRATSVSNRCAEFPYWSVDSSLLNLKERRHWGIFAFGVFPTQHKVLRCLKDERFYKYLIGKISSEHIRLTKLLLNNCFSGSVKIHVSEDRNSGEGGGLQTHESFTSPQNHTFSLLGEKKIRCQSGSPTPLFFKDHSFAYSKNPLVFC